MSKLYEFSIRTEKTGWYNITRELTEAVKSGGVESGFAIIHCPHTTAGLTFNENTDPNVGLDLIRAMDMVYPESPEYLHTEGNSPAHLKCSTVGSQLLVIIDDNWPLLGIWQNVYFVEFDGPRERKYYIKLVGD